jgi:hypothetical protein
MQVHNMAQGTPEWFSVRKGIPTASRFKDVLAKGEGKTRGSYLSFLAGEIITGEPGESFKSEAMDRGHAMEPVAREYYAKEMGVETEAIGFITNGRKGGSPDSLIGKNGLLEIKTCKPNVLIEHLRKDKFPAEHILQCMGNLWVAEREWIDIICFWPGMPALIKRMTRDDALIGKLNREVNQFNDDLDLLVDRIKSYKTNL